MAFIFQPDWDLQPQNNNGATEAQITTICATAGQYGRGDAGLLEALTEASDQVTVTKGIHQDTIRTFPHITVDYLGALWHVGLVQTAGGGVAGWRVGTCTQ